MNLNFKNLNTNEKEELIKKMNEMKKYEQKNTIKGITLIALVVTIIVLLILAGVSIATLTSDGGILNNAASAKNNTNIQQTIEQARTDIMGLQVSGQKGNITTDEFRSVLSNYFYLNGVTDEDLENSDFELTTINGNYTIKVGQIYNGSLSELPIYNVDVDPEEIHPEHFTYELDEETNTATITGFKDAYISKYYRLPDDEDTPLTLVDRLVIPSEIDKYTVTRVKWRQEE